MPVFEVGGYLDKVSKRVIAIANTKGEGGALINRQKGWPRIVGGKVGTKSIR